MMMDDALHGIRVADFSRVLAGPYASMMLADLGADVIKIESPNGDDTRHWMPPVDSFGRSTYFSAVNRNKRSMVCDLRSPDGYAAARALALEADVIIENFRPGVMERLGFDYAELSQGNPGLIWCSITGFGREKGAALAGYDLLVQALGGLMSITGAPDTGPMKVGVALVDILTGQNALSGILAALHVRARSGAGQRVDVNLLSSLLSGLANQASSTLATGESPRRMGNEHPSIAPYGVYRASDRELVIAVGNDHQFAALAAELGTPELATDSRYRSNELRVRNRAELRIGLEELLAQRSARSWTGALTAAGVPAGPVNSIAEAFDLARDLGLPGAIDIVDEATGVVSRQVANPIALSSTPARYRRVPPALGQHPNAQWIPRPQ
ncbi:MAG TPA: CoA transferase, partial [Terrimesophilobacter sp.]|nr:CoA transferase [Terrimesophilobacter sp.]